MDWRANLIDDAREIGALIRPTRCIAVLGIKIEAQFDQPSVYVPRFLMEAGVDIVPVPVDFLGVTEIFGLRVYRRLSDICVFRANPAGHFAAFRPAVSLHSGHPFRSIPATPCGG